MGCSVTQFDLAQVGQVTMRQGEIDPDSIQDRGFALAFFKMKETEKLTEADMVNVAFMDEERLDKFNKQYGNRKWN